MWKVGDRIRFVKEGKKDSKISYGFILNKTYEIININHTPDKNFYHKSHISKDGKKYMVNINMGWWIEPDCFESEFTGPLTESQKLDRIRMNILEDL